MQESRSLSTVQNNQRNRQNALIVEKTTLRGRVIAKELQKLRKNDQSHFGKTAYPQQIIRNVTTARENVSKTNSLGSQVGTDGTSFASVAKIGQRNDMKSKPSEDNAILLKILSKLDKQEEFNKELEK